MGDLKSNPALIYLGILLITGISACNTGSRINPEVKMLEKNWKLFSSADVDVSGEIISSPGYKCENEYNTAIPNTVLAALVENEVYKDIHFSDNFDKIPEEPFTVPWWYRKSFVLEYILKNEVYRLVFEGINYRANVWMNGQLVVSADTMEGCFRIFDFEVTDYLNTSENVLAVEVIPPKDQELTIGFVDWNPWPPDNNLGIWRPVKLVKSGRISMKQPFVNPSVNLEQHEASLTISTVLTNHSNTNVKGTVKCKIINSFDQGYYEILKEKGVFMDSVKERVIEMPYTLAPEESKKVIFNPADYEQLNISNPRLWWPNLLGNPELYSMELIVNDRRVIADKYTTHFGIREVSDYLNKNGHRGYKINGRKILIRGAGWVDDVLLADDDKKVKAQIEYVKHMGLNTIRLEGFWGRNKKIYEYADEYGLLIMIGWSCQWEWEGYCGRPEDDKYMSINTPEDIALHSRSYMDQVLWLRNHPSVFLWVYGSDKLIVPEMEKKINAFIEKEDPTLSNRKS
ncbi:glycoside hydrolase family 2 protein [Bacteroidota bacterium]